MLKIWGRLSSINVRKVVLARSGSEFRSSAPTRAMNSASSRRPTTWRRTRTALVPLIEDGDFTLWESNVIVRYLCARHAPGRLYPEDLRATLRRRALDGLAADHAEPGRAPRLHAVHPDAGRAARPGVDREIGRGHRAADGAAGRAPGAPAPSWPATRSPWPTSPSPAKFDRWQGLPRERPARPHLERWYRGILAHPAARGVLDLPLS